jgi:hypothetical protein
MNHIGFRASPRTTLVSGQGGWKMRKLLLIIVMLIILYNCTALDNSGKHAPIYLTDPRYAHFRNPSMSDPAPWPDCANYNATINELIGKGYGP